MPEHKLAFIGFGNVGRALARLLIDKTAEMRLKHDIKWRTVGIATRSKGIAINQAGIDLKKAIQTVEDGGNLERFHQGQPLEDTFAFIQRCEADVLFEISYLNPHTGEPALSYSRTALNHGMHVVTANKGPIVHAYGELRDLAQQQNRKLLFESIVMDGTPIFSTFREALPVSNIQQIRGVLNSTTNLILTDMEKGIVYEQAVRHAQEIGIAEADPTNDVEGWDSAVKIAALATVLMDSPITPDRVDRTGITGLSAQDVQQAASSGRPYKLLCLAERTPDGIKASVKPAQLEASDPLANLTGTSSAISFTMDTLKEIIILGINPGPRQTAYGMLADFINAVRN